MQEELLSAGQFPYFPQGNPGKFLCIYLCSACTVKSRVFWTPRALLSFLKCYLAHRAQPDAWHTGVSAPSLHSMWALARGLSGLRTEPLPQMSSQMPWNPQWLPQGAFLTFLGGKKLCCWGSGGDGSLGCSRTYSSQEPNQAPVKPVSRGCWKVWIEFS